MCGMLRPLRTISFSRYSIRTKSHSFVIQHKTTGENLIEFDALWRRVFLQRNAQIFSRQQQKNCCNGKNVKQKMLSSKSIKKKTEQQPGRSAEPPIVKHNSQVESHFFPVTFIFHLANTCVCDCQVRLGLSRRRVFCLWFIDFTLSMCLFGIYLFTIEFDTIFQPEILCAEISVLCALFRNLQRWKRVAALAAAYQSICAHIDANRIKSDLDRVGRPI